jgi:UDP-N-acetyl-D-mannosaminuronic acid transferase (WecB/TagA/CpsF family)
LKQHCRLAFEVGALFDFVTEQFRRAPPSMRSVRLEWVYRLIQEPKPLWRRYLVGNLLFVFRVLGQRSTGLCDLRSWLLDTDGKVSEGVTRG